jgi:hypothetical protein
MEVLTNPSNSGSIPALSERTIIFDSILPAAHQNLSSLPGEIEGIRERLE